MKTKILAAFFGSCFFILSCENDMATVKSIGSKKIGVEEAKNVESLLSQEGKLKAKLTAPYMLRYQLDTVKVEFPNSIKVIFYGEGLKVESQLTAKYAIYRENESKVFLKDSIVVFNVTGDTLWTDELYWDQVKEIFYTDKNVIYKTPTQKWYASGMEADQNFKNVSMVKVRNSYIVIPDSSFLMGY